MEIGYKEQIENLMNRIPIIRKEQLKLYLVKTFGTSVDIADLLIDKALYSGYILISTNGLVTTRAATPRICNEEYMHEKNYLHMFTKPIMVTQEIETYIDVFWAILKNLPESDNFVIMNGPIDAVYPDSKKNRIIEVIKIPLGEEQLYTNLFKHHFTYTKESQEYYERIGILEDPKRASLVGYVGFTELYYINKDNPDGHVMYFVEERDNSIAWKDVVCVKENIKENNNEL